MRFKFLPLLTFIAALGAIPSAATADTYSKLVSVTPLVCEEGGDHNISRVHTTRLGANNLKAVCMIWGAGDYPQAYLEVYHVTDPAYVPRQGMAQWRYDLHVGYATYTMTRKWTWELPKPPRDVTPTGMPSGVPTGAAKQPQTDSPTDEPSDDPETPVGDPEDDNNNNNGGGNGGGSSCNNGIGNGGDGCDPGNSGGTPNGGQDG